MATFFTVDEISSVFSTFSMVNFWTFAFYSILDENAFKSVLVDIVDYFSFSPFETIFKGSSISYTTISWNQCAKATHFSMEPITFVKVPISEFKFTLAWKI